MCYYKLVDYHYEIGNIATKRNVMDFDFFSGILKSKCQNNDLILGELEHMEQNISDEIEYYTSLRLICLELKEEQQAEPLTAPLRYGGRSANMNSSAINKHSSFRQVSASNSPQRKAANSYGQ